MEPRHEKIAKIALGAAGDRGLALAGGYAVGAHGMGHRPSGDVDLFTDWRDREDFPEVLAAVVSALERHGFTVEISAQGDTFARLLVAEDRAAPVFENVELAADWRAHPPVLMEVGPVLHPDDAVANKMCALFGRAMPRDFLDVDAAIVNGAYTRERLLELAMAADSGFDPVMFAHALGALNQITDDAFMEYGTPGEQIAAMRRRFAQWRERLAAGE